jgi:hypothetical protein
MANKDENIIHELTPDLKKQFAEFTLATVPLFQALEVNDQDDFSEKFILMWQQYFIDAPMNGVELLSWLFAQHHAVERAWLISQDKNVKEAYFERETIAAMISNDPSYFDVAYKTSED